MTSLIVLKQAVISFFMAFLASAIWIVPLIDFLYKLQFTAYHVINPDKKNEEWVKLNAMKNGTPSLGGIIIWITAPVLWLWLFPGSVFTKYVSLIFFMIGLYGFIEGVFDMFTKKDPRLRMLHDNFAFRILKLGLTYCIHLIVSYILINRMGIKYVDIFNLRINLNNYYIPIIAFISLASSYSTDLIDGMDALAAGLFTWTNLGWLLLSMASINLFTVGNGCSIAGYVGVILGILTVYLYFNIPPARVFMGAPGALPMGTFFFSIALYTNTLVPFFIFMTVYYVDTLTSIIQIISLEFFNKRVFRIAPFHHHFHALGWPESKVVMRFHLFNLVFVLLGILVYLLSI